MNLMSSPKNSRRPEGEELITIGCKGKWIMSITANLRLTIFQNSQGICPFI